MICFGPVFERLLSTYGPQGWWPGEGRFEVMLGAILVQRTAWRNAESAIAKLRHEGLQAPERLRNAATGDVERCIRSAGFFRTKAQRVRSLAAFVDDSGGVDSLARLPTGDLRALLLDLDGVGPETADAILLYAFDRPVVVIDAYLRRLAQRLLETQRPPADTDLRLWVGRDVDHARSLNEFHALVVAHGKQICGTVPLCDQCSIRRLCRTGHKA